MNVDVDKLKDKFLNKINNLYNQEVYFVESCITFPEKYPLSHSLADLQLQIFFEENNFVILDGKCIKYCDKDNNKKIRLINISEGVEMPEVEINNYIVENTWKKIDW